MPHEKVDLLLPLTVLVTVKPFAENCMANANHAKLQRPQRTLRVRRPQDTTHRTRSDSMTTAQSGHPMVNDKREIFGWAMYDWANSAFSTTVVTVFLGPYLTSIAKGAADAGGSLHLLGIPIRFDSYFTYLISASVLLQVAILPILGALADYSHLRKQLMQFFAFLGAASTILMFTIRPGGHWWAGLLFLVANVAFGASIVFYNSYLPNIASEDRRDAVSSYGWAMGYLGGGLLLLLNLVMYLFSGKLGLDSSMVARISLASAGVWWLGFSLFTFTRLRPRHAPRPLPPGETYLTIGFKQLATLIGIPQTRVAGLMLLPLAIPILILLRVPVQFAILPGAGPIIILITFIARKSRTLPEAMKYLAAYLLYNDGIQTVISVSAIFAANELGMGSTQLILVILMIQFVAFLGALGFNWIASKIGTKADDPRQPGRLERRDDLRLRRHEEHGHRAGDGAAPVGVLGAGLRDRPGVGGQPGAQPQPVCTDDPAGPGGRVLLLLRDQRTRDVLAGHVRLRRRQPALPQPPPGHPFGDRLLHRRPDPSADGQCRQGDERGKTGIVQHVGPDYDGARRHARLKPPGRPASGC